MISSSSLMHPSVKASIRVAVFEAAANVVYDSRGQGHGKSYVENSKGNFFMRVDWIVHRDGGQFARFYGESSKRIDAMVQEAFGDRGYAWVEKLAQALAHS